MTVSLLRPPRGGAADLRRGLSLRVRAARLLQAGAFVPEIVLSTPTSSLGSTASSSTPARTSSRRSLLRPPREAAVIGRGSCSTPLNRAALAIAAAVARDTNSLLAGNICNTNVFAPDGESRRTVRAVFDEQVAWIAEAGADFVMERRSATPRRRSRLESILAAGLSRDHALGPPRARDPRRALAGRRLRRASSRPAPTSSALNCTRGPATMLPLIEAIRRASAATSRRCRSRTARRRRSRASSR